jgi:formylglycine-generating enzyme required for sulfatase activity
MAKKGQSKLSFWIKVAFIGASLPLLLSHQSWAKNCPKTEINSKIEQFKDVKKAKAAIDAVVQCGEDAIAPLEQALNEDEAAIRANAASALGKMGAIAQDAAPALVAALGDSESAVRTEAASALIQIGRAVQKQEDVSWWNVKAVQKLETLQQNLVEARKRLEADKRDWGSKKEEIDHLGRVSNALQAKLSRLEEGQPYQIIQWLKANPWAWVAAGGIAGYLGIFIFHPIFLLKLYKWVKPASLKIPQINLDVSLGNLLFLKYHPRVLDCWVAEHLSQVQSHFLEQPTVSDRAIHIPILIKLKEKPIERLAPPDLRPVFSQSPTCLLIVGEGGVGKTSLAYQIARWGLGLEEAAKGQSLCSHRLLPVTIEQELENTTLLTAIKEQLPRTPEGDYIADELLEALLKRQRVLVILDHVSEMSDQTYNQMKDALSKTPVNALIITSRLKEKDLGRPHKTLLEPQKIEGARLSTFIQPYLEARGKRDIFEDDAEFYRTCTRLATMMAATLQSATVLLVRMYVDQVIEVGGFKTALLPDDIPTLMVKYLEWLNRDDAIDRARRQDDSAVLQAAKAVAWICVRDKYYPAEASYEDVIRVLTALSQAENPQQDAKERLTYLEKTLRLVQRSANRVKIILDPVAEYLAAFKVVAVCQQQEGEEPWQEFFKMVDAKPEQEATQPWEKFFQTVDAKTDLGQIRGFLLAVRNCGEQEGKKLPEGVLAGLNQRANLNPEELEQARRRQQINRLIDELYYAEPKYLGQAIGNLRDEGTYAHKAIPDLLKVLKSDKEKIEAALRVEALNALMQIQVDTEKRNALCREVLGNRSDAPEVRVAAIKALLQLGRESQVLEELLWGYFQDETEVGVVRVQAGEGLRKLGVLQELLVVKLSEDATPTIHLIAPPQTLIISLSEEVKLVMVFVPGGTFMMGSPEGEGSDSERPQHEVTVPDFWMGQFPVTQAQYEAVMGRNPATFKGSNRPVETLSWYDAVAFCQRLSELTGQDFRLPSEAEWEYACRAVTSGKLTQAEWNEKYNQPFHFGSTITTDLANYRGTDRDYGGTVYRGAYGQGPKGIFRKQTTEIGSFPPNAFGLYDMHGNVWEWCADRWHDNYNGAPDDGSPWLKENASHSQNRVLRGGSWYSNPDHCRSANCRSANRFDIGPDNGHDDFGFRVVAVART